MTAIYPLPHFHNLTNQFRESGSAREINFRNQTVDRTNVSNIEIRGIDRNITTFWVDPDDNVAMALALLGVGRVTDKLEERAQRRADCIGVGLNPATTDDLMDTVVVHLRAILIAKQREEQAVSEDLEDAYALYKLCYPSTTTDFETFKGLSLKDHWVVNLKVVRKDPTRLVDLRTL